MTKHKVGLVLFWSGGIWAILSGVIISWFLVGPAFRNLSMAELSQTFWAPDGIGTMMWGIGTPLGALIAGIGILLFSGARGSTIWKIGIGTFFGFAVSIFLMSLQLGHSPSFFGVGGTLILLFFLGILWLWAKERKALKETSTASADLRLVGYMFMLIAAWFVCGLAGQPFLKALEGETMRSPIHVMIFLVLGWFFLFLGHYKSRQKGGETES